MEFYLLEMAGIAFFSMLFYIYLVISGQKDYTLRFCSMYCFVFFTAATVLQIILEDPSFVRELCKFCLPLLFVLSYTLFAGHKLSRKEISLLIFVSAIGIVPFLMACMTIFSFVFFGQGM